MAKVTRSHNLSTALDKLERATGLALTGAGHILAQRMQERAPIASTRMMRSVHVSDVQRGDDGPFVLVGPTVEYAKYTEEPRYIFLAGPGLRFKQLGPKSQIKGPPTSIPWMIPSLRDTEKELREFIENGLRIAVRGLAKR